MEQRQAKWIMVAVGKRQQYPCYLKKGWMKYRKPFSFALFRSSHMTWSAQVWAKLKYLHAGRTPTYHILERQTNKQQHSQPGYIWSLPSGSLRMLCCAVLSQHCRIRENRKVCAHHATALPHRLQIPQPTSTQQHLTPFPSSRHLNPPCSIISNFLKFFHKL